MAIQVINWQLTTKDVRIKLKKYTRQFLRDVTLVTDLIFTRINQQFLFRSRLYPADHLCFNAE